MSARSIAVIGTGYVGLTTGACLASLGHVVTCADIDPMKVALLRRGEIPIREDGLADLVAQGLESGRLRFVVGASAAVADAAFVFLCVPTPMGADGSADLAAVEAVANEVRDLLQPGTIVVNKSTVPVGTSVRTAALLGRGDIHVVSNPEFLREGTAVHDFLNPDRVVVGGGNERATALVAELYQDLNVPIVRTDAASAEMIKYAANCFLAMKLSYVNTISALCEHLGADVTDVVAGIGQDPRIGKAFLNPGPGWGGSCLPKDTHALLQMCTNSGFEFPLLDASLEANLRQQERIIEKVRGAIGFPLRGRRICLLGLTFKAGTNDLRDSPAVAIAELLYQEGAELVGYDPAIPAPVPGLPAIIDVVDDPVDAARGASAIVVLTEWSEFTALPWAEMEAVTTHSVVVDTRNILNSETLTECGFTVHQLGTRPRIPDPSVLLDRVPTENIMPTQQRRNQLPVVPPTT